MKKQRKVEKDNRGVAIYARKSRITNKGDSIGVQFKQCADYAKKELGLDEEYEFLQYEDKGLSGYFSDRPDFQRMLHDVQDGKIKAIVCYKLDRVGRKTADLIRLMDFLEMYHVNLLICSNGINTASGLYKIFIQIFAVIAEFERDTLTERIVDNMMELAKDGRWLGGNTPMGFTVRRVTTGSGKGKSSYSYLESLPEEKRMVQRLYEIFRTTRSIQSTAKQMNEEGFHTPSGAAFNASTTRLVLRNPIYCTADKCSYDYFIDHDGNVFGDMIEFDGTHGLSAYNKTDQEKYEGSDSTFISPKYVQTIESKPVSEWIIAVGKHEGFIPSEQWIEVQELLDAIAEKYNRPHRKTNSLLAGLAHCPHCGRRLSVISESDRWTNGKPRFKYVCPGYRKKECNFKALAVPRSAAHIRCVPVRKHLPGAYRQGQAVRRLPSAFSASGIPPAPALRRSDASCGSGFLCPPRNGGSDSMRFSAWCGTAHGRSSRRRLCPSAGSPASFCWAGKSGAGWPARNQTRLSQRWPDDGRG